MRRYNDGSSGGPNVRVIVNQAGMERIPQSKKCQLFGVTLPPSPPHISLILSYYISVSYFTTILTTAVSPYSTADIR